MTLGEADREVLRKEIEKIVDQQLGKLITTKLEELEKHLPSPTDPLVGDVTAVAIVEMLVASAACVATAAGYPRERFDQIVEATWRLVTKTAAETRDRDLDA